MSLPRLAGGFDGYDLDFNETDERHHYPFLVHPLAAAMCSLMGSGDDLDAALSDALAVVPNGATSETGAGSSALLGNLPGILR